MNIRPIIPLCGAVAILAGGVLLSPVPLAAQGWERVVNLADTAGSAVGGGDGTTLYSGLVSGHVFRSDDNGRTWTVVTNGLVDSFGGMLVPKAFVVTPTGRVLRGGDNASWQNKVGSPVFVSDNRGGQWTEIPLPFGTAPRNPAGIGISDLVRHKGALYFSDLLSEGVWKSTDDGASWTASGADLPTIPFIGFSKTCHALADAGTALLTVEPYRGVFRSTDGGATWSQAVAGIPGVLNSPLVSGRSWTGSDVVATPDGTAFAVVDQRVYRSRDAGATWTEVGEGLFLRPNPFVPSILAPSARKVEILGDRVFVTTEDPNPRFFEGTTTDDSWSELPRIEGNETPASLLAQSFLAHNGALYFAGSKGVYRLDLDASVRTNLAPVVTTTPAGPFYANVGGRVTVTASVRGTAPFSFTWRIDGTAIPGQTGPTLDLAATDPATQTGTLSVVVANAAGTVTRELGRLTVSPVGPGLPDFSFRPQRPGIVTAFAVDRDGSVFFAGPFTSQTEAYTGVRRAFADGRIDPAFVTGAMIGAGTGPGASAGTPAALLPLGDGSVLVGASGTTAGQRYYRRLLADGSVDPAWPWPQEVAGGPRKIVRLADGRFLIAGGSLGGIHRLHPDGTFDPTFQSPASAWVFQADHVRDFAILPDGRILIAGSFRTVDGEPRVALARLHPDGPLDRAWIPAALPAGSEINAIAVGSDGRILIGGAFLTVDGQPHRNLARLMPDGSVDASLGDLIPATAPAGVVHALAAQPDGRVWVGGSFFGVQGRNYLFRLNTDGTVDTGFPDVGFNVQNGGGVRSLAFAPDGRLWIGSALATVRNEELGNLFRIFTDIAGPTRGYAGLDRVANPGETVVLEGTVTGPHTGLQWRFEGQPVPGGTGLRLTLPQVDAGRDGRYDLVVTSAGGTSTSAPVRLRIRGPVVVDRHPAPAVGVVSNSVTFTVTAFGHEPLAYQWFLEGAALDGRTGRTLVLTNLQPAMAGDYTVRVTGADGSTRDSEPAFLTVIPPPGSASAAFQPALFTTSGPTEFRDIGFLPDGRVLVGGRFSTTGNGGPNAILARLNPDGSVDGGFQFDASGVSEFVALDRMPDGRLMVLIRLSAGAAPYVVRRLAADGTRDPGFASHDILFGADLRAAPDGGVVVVSQGGVERFGPDGTPDTAFNQRARLNNQALSLDIDPAGRIYVAGYFNTVGGQPRAHIARLQPDGTLDTAFAPTHVFSGERFVRALPEGALVGDLNGMFRFDDLGRRDLAFGWNGRLAAWDLTATGGLLGVLANTAGDGVLRTGEGFPALPIGAFKVPGSFSGYSFLRAAPDGSWWLAIGGNGSAVAPASVLYRLNGSVTPLAILTHPESRVALAGGAVELRVTATGTSALRYQWRRNGDPVPGQTNATLALAPFSAAQAGDYTVEVSNRSGSVVSRVAAVRLLAAPVVTGEPASLVASPGETVAFEIAASGLQLAYQWRAGGTNIPGATSPRLTLAAVTADAAGLYSVRVTNPAGTAESRSARLRVRPAPATGGGGGPTNGLVARLRFENDFTESVAGITTSVTGSPGFAPGVEGDTAAALRAGQNWVRIGTGTGAGGRLTDEQFTVAFWIRAESQGSLNPYSLIALAPGANPGTFVAREHFLYLGGNDGWVQNHRVFLATRTTTSVHSSDDRAYVPNLVGKWTHFAVVYRGGGLSGAANFSVYVNGDSLPLTDSANLVGGTPSLVNSLGRYAPQGNFQMDDFRVYNRPLSEAEVDSILTPGGGDPAPAITGPPQGGSVAAGGNFTFTVAATGPGLFYEWYRGDTLLAEADGPVLELAGVGPADAGAYRVVISNPGGSAESGPAVLEVTGGADPFAEWVVAEVLTGADADPGTDTDLDGANNLAEFTYGTGPKSAASRPRFEVLTVNVAGVDYPAVAFTRRSRLGNFQVRIRPGASLDFAEAWEAVTVSVTPRPDGLEDVVVRSPEPSATGRTQFFRFTVQ